MKFIKNIKVKKNTGFSLIELMVAMTIGLFLVGGILAMFVSTKNANRINQNLSLAQENGRYAFEYLAREIRQAGFQIDSSIEPIIGYEGASDAPASLSLSSYTPNTDLIVITYQYQCYDEDTAECDDPGDSDDNTTKIKRILFYIAPSSFNSVPGLYKKDTINFTAKTSQELLSNVYDMQLRYGIRTTGKLEYKKASEIADWSTVEVATIKIDLLIGTPENNIVDTSMSLPFERNDGTMFTASDRRIYQMLSTTIATRNRKKT